MTNSRYRLLTPIAIFVFGTAIGCIFTWTFQKTYAPMAELVPVVLERAGELEIITYRIVSNRFQRPPFTPYVSEQPERYLKGCGGLQPLDLANLSLFVNVKYADHPNDVDAQIADFIRLHNQGYEVVILQSADDIPGFDPNALDPDIKPEKLKPTIIQQEHRQILICYTWDRVGGVLDRYRFFIDLHGPSCISYATIQSDLGDCVYLQ